MFMNSWAFWALLSAVFAALTGLFAKLGVQQINADLATLIRTLIICGLLSLFVALTGKWSNPLQLSGKTWGYLILSAAATGASWVCYFRALQLGQLFQVAPIDKLSLVMVAIFAVLFLGERPSLREWLGLGLVAAGVLLLIWRR